MKIIPSPIAFQWDHGNVHKNLHKHGVTNEECEEVFFDHRKLILKDTLHSAKEDRHILVGHTKLNRPLFIIFTVREVYVRIISARDLNKKENKLFL